MVYQVPNDFYFRIHHPRSRFKNDPENVLFYFSQKLTEIGEHQDQEFVSKFLEKLREYPGNGLKTNKTLNNWRTEISSFFGFVQSENGYSRPSRRALELAEKEDLVQMFKTFLFNFQYPGFHIKNKQVIEQIENGIIFKPAQYILTLLKDSSGPDKKNYITKEEACHMIFNDLRITRDHESPEKVWQRIVKNRQDGVQYDSRGDVVRYAGDIIDYMKLANLLKTYDGKKFYLNTLEEESIQIFIHSKERFEGLDKFYNSNTSIEPSILNEARIQWFRYMNRNMDETDFKTDLIAFISEDEQEYEYLKKMQVLSETEQRLIEGEATNTKEIGDFGEALIHTHEINRIKRAGRADLAHLIHRIPTYLAVGYDILSVEEDATKRFIEVKTTISNTPLRTDTIHMTTNEWNAARTLRKNYYLYRLWINQSGKKLFLLQDPVGKDREDLIYAIPHNSGMDLRVDFKNDKTGNFEELLTHETT